MYNENITQRLKNSSTVKYPTVYASNSFTPGLLVESRNQGDGTETSCPINFLISVTICSPQRHLVAKEIVPRKAATVIVNKSVYKCCNLMNLYTLSGKKQLHETLQLLHYVIPSF